MNKKAGLGSSGRTGWRQGVGAPPFSHIATLALGHALRISSIGVMVAVILALASGGRSSAIAQSYPTAPVKLIVTTGAGGAPDVIARIVAEGLSHRWGQQAFVANHPGAAGSIGMKVAGSAPADGYTLLFALSSSFVALPEIAKDYPYDLVRDFVSIGFVCEQPMAIAVPPSLGVNTLGELINYVKKRPGEINVAVLSRGGIPHLTSEWIKLAAGLDWTSINYPGTPAGLSDVMGGRVQVIMDGLPSLAGSINGGTLKLLAVGSAQRLPAGHADHRRNAARNPARARLLRADGTARHARADRRQDQRRSARGAGRAGHQEALRGHRQLHPSDVGRRVAGLYPNRAGAVEAGDRADQHLQGGAQVTRAGETRVRSGN